MDLLFLQCGFTFVFVVFLQMEGRMVHHLAIDRPSHKFVSFLKKYYGLKNAIPQVRENFIKSSSISMVIIMISNTLLIMIINNY